MKRFFLLLYALFCFDSVSYGNNQRIPMKVKRLLYEFFTTIDGVDASRIRCEVVPKNVILSNSIIMDPFTKLPEVSVTYDEDIIYLDDATLEAIRQSYSLSPALKLQLLYRVGMLKVAGEKYRRRLHGQLDNIKFVVGALAFLSLEGVVIALGDVWADDYSQLALLLGKVGVGCAMLCGVIALVQKKMRGAVDFQKDLVSIRQRAQVWRESNCRYS